LEEFNTLSPSYGAKAMPASDLPAVAAPPFIEVLEVTGEWFVRVVEHSNEIISSFEREALALAYAEGQRIRLGLAEIVRL
jgi:hypothetical protein